ncbi:MAG: hypothetical protein ACI31A_07655 [Candidatus Limisoma sp.]
MKKLVIIATSTLLSLIGSACGNKVNAENGTKAAVDSTVTFTCGEEIMPYVSTLESVASTLCCGSEEFADGMYEVYRTALTGDQKIDLGAVGYTLRTIGDEQYLIIGGLKDRDYNTYGSKANPIINLYRQDGDEIKLIVSGYYYRDEWYLTKHDELLNVGAVSASTEITALYDIRDGELLCNHFWMRYYDLHTMEYTFYHSYEPMYEPNEGATKLDWTEQDYRNNIESHMELAVEFPLTPISTLRPLAATQNGNKVTFTTSAEVHNLKVLALSDANFSDGMARFTERTAATKSSLKPGERLTVDMAFNGDTPEHGIEFVDALGRTVKMAITISGDDGSLIMYQYYCSDLNYE